MWGNMWGRIVPKLTGRHPEKRLSAIKINSLREPGRYTDGNGLYLEVTKSGSRHWLLRTVVQGRRRDIGLGSVTLVSLAEAREEATRVRKSARSGGDPLQERRLSRAAGLSFEEAARKVFEAHKDSWKNVKHREQWINTLSTYAFPLIGKRPIVTIQPADILSVLAPIWLTKPETGRRVRQRLSTVFDWAKASGLRDGENPVQGVVKGLPRQPSKDNHHAALPFVQIPSFVSALRESVSLANLAFEFLILTATRTNEVLEAEWGEIDSAKRVWVIPADRMKMGKEHRVPLSERALEILKYCGDIFGREGFIFKGRDGKRGLSNTVFLMTIRRMNLQITGHGFRSSFRDWASETTPYSNEVCEMALAHVVGNKAEAAYRRGDLFEKRRNLMDDWAAFCGQHRQPDGYAYV